MVDTVVLTETAGVKAPAWILGRALLWDTLVTLKLCSPLQKRDEHPDNPHGDKMDVDALKVSS